MKRLLLLTCAAFAVHGISWAASVYDDAKVWFRGGYDANGDGVVDIADIVAVINKASGAELDAEAYPGNTDINADGVVDIADIVAVINIASGSAS